MKILDNTIVSDKEDEVPEFPCYWASLGNDDNEGMVVLFFDSCSGVVVEPAKGYPEHKVGYFYDGWGSCYNGSWERMPKGYSKSFTQE